jgi:hypothetical protein
MSIEARDDSGADHDFPTSIVMRTSSARDAAPLFLHDPGSMNLKGALTHTELVRHDLVALALHYEREHFARRERGEARADAVVLVECCARLGVFGERVLNAIDQVLIAEGRLEESVCAVLHGLDRRRDVAVSRNEDDGNDGAAQIQLLLQLDAAHTRHPHIEHEAAVLVRIVVREKNCLQMRTPGCPGSWISAGSAASCAPTHHHRPRTRWGWDFFVLAKR